MEEMQNSGPRPVNPRRRKRTKMEIFKESYLPVIIAGVALLFILITIIGSAVQRSQRKKAEKLAAIEAALAAQEEAERLEAEFSRLMEESAEYAADYNYTQAIAVLESFTGNPAGYPQLGETIRQYQSANDALVAWSDPAQVLNLSFQLLIADPIRAFSNASYGTSYNKNFVTTDEFRIILEQLYNNGYILVSLSDIVEAVTTEEGVSYAPKTIYLPEGKKPLILTQTHVNYNIFMTDGDGDKLPDKNGAGFASKLIVDANGQLTNEYVDRDGNTLTGEYDLIPILNSFIAENPDFSYRDARAIIAVTGYDGLFGYRTNPGAKEWLGTDAYNQEIEKAKAIAQALRDTGYEIACYTYENNAYGNMSLSQIQEDLSKWNSEVVPILGNVDILAFAQLSDIGDHSSYEGEKFNALMGAGFRYYLGFCQDGALWAAVENSYFRQARILVTGANLKYNSSWFEGILDPVQILSSTRGTIPQ